MLRFFVTVAALAFAVSDPFATQPEILKSGPAPDSVLPGSFQPLNINGPFAGRQHCLVTEFRLNPVALVFVRSHADRVDPEVKKLLDTLEKAVEERHDDTGLDSFAVFLASQARSGVTEEAKDKDSIQLAKAVATEIVEREKMVNFLKGEFKSFQRLIVTCAPPDRLKTQYALEDKAEVTVVLYARHRVISTHAFADGQLNQAGVDSVMKGIDTMTERLKKAGPGK